MKHQADAREWRNGRGAGAGIIGGYGELSVLVEYISVTRLHRRGHGRMAGMVGWRPAGGDQVGQASGGG